MAIVALFGRYRKKGLTFEEWLKVQEYMKKGGIDRAIPLEPSGVGTSDNLDVT